MTLDVFHRQSDPLLLFDGTCACCYAECVPDYQIQYDSCRWLVTYFSTLRIEFLCILRLQENALPSREDGSESMIIVDAMRREVGDFSLVSLLMAHQSS